MKGLYTPTPDWQGQSAYLIGGGSSLSYCNFDIFTGKNVIGINDAFKLGAGICKVCLFGDAAFFHKNVQGLDAFTGKVVTCSPNLIGLQVGWLNRMHRERDGLYSGDTLGWNHSTGAAAINLAISLGATKIYLLGYDGGKVNGKTHWHKFRNKDIGDESYARFAKGFKTLFHCITPNLGIEVFNVTDGQSMLADYQRITWPDFLKGGVK